MSRSSALVLLAALSFACPVHAKPDPPTKLKIGPVTCTTATIVIEPPDPAPCQVQLELGAHYVAATGPLDKQVVHLVGLTPETKYEFRITCGQSAPVDSALRTPRRLAPLPPRPTPPKLTFVAATTPKMWTVSASFTPPAGIPTACWWEVHSKWDLFPATIYEEDCSQWTSASYPTPLSHGHVVRFGMRNANGEASFRTSVP